MTVTNILVLPTFGGISASGNEALDQDLNAEPMPFSIGMDDNPSVLVSNSQGNLVNT
jgi:hypothetical protein